MREKPWQAIDLMTNETLGWYKDSNDAYIQNPGRAIDVSYRPGRKTKVKKGESK